MAGVVHILAQLSPNRLCLLQRLLENLRVYCCFADSEGPWYTKGGRLGRYRFLAEFIVDNSARNDELAFARSRKAFENADTEQQRQILAGLEELRDAIWFCFVRDKLKTCFGRKYGHCATKLFELFDKARQQSPTTRLFSQTAMIEMFRKATADCVDYGDIQEFMQLLVKLTKKEPGGSDVEKLRDWPILRTNIVRFTKYIYWGSQPPDVVKTAKGTETMSQALDDLRRAVLGSPSSSPDQTLVAYTNEEQNRAFVAVMFRRLFEELGYYTLKEQVGDDEEMLLKRSSSEGAPWRLFCNFISRGPIERCLRGLPQPQREICVAVMKNMHQNLKKLPQGPIAGRFPTDAEIDTAGLKEIAYPFGARLSSGELLKGSQIARHGISKEALQKAMMKILKMLRPTVEDGKVNWMKELDRHIDRNALRARGQLGKMDRLR